MTRPTDSALAFPLRSVASALPAVGAETDIRELLLTLLGEEAAARFERRVKRWSGPDQYESEQVLFREAGARDRLNAEDVEQVLDGSVLVLRNDGRTDYVMRDHHMIDVACYHFATSGTFPSALFHADRHSDWCRDANLSRPVEQAATWWALLEGLKRPNGVPVLRERDVFFVTARAAHEAWMPGREVATSLTVPGSVDTSEMDWAHVLERPEVLTADWVSLDLDYLQPSPQLRLASGMLREEQFARLMKQAKVRVFVLSPQFTRGGDRFERWLVHGSRGSSLRLLNLLRGRGVAPRPKSG
ncbi:MAG: hypothetical protein ACT4TC_19930 [Myxococcaceae bacterium]